MTTFPLPALTLPDSLHTVADLRDALERANRCQVEQAVRLGVLTGAVQNLAEQLDALLNLHRAGQSAALAVALDALLQRHDGPLPGRRRGVH